MTQAHSGYNLFAASVKASLTRAELTEPHLNADGTAAAIGFAAAVAARWRALEPEQRQEWNDRSQANQKAHKLPGWERIGKFYINRELDICVGAPPYSVQQGLHRIKACERRQEKRLALSRASGYNFQPAPSVTNLERLAPS